MEITTRPIREDEALTFRAAVSAGFGDDFDGTIMPEEWFFEMFPRDRTVAAFDGDAMVGTLGAFPFDVTVPGGGGVPMAGTTVVTVAPTHRRRGVLTAMMRDHLLDTIARNEPLAGLWASESIIYGRYGFGVATENEEVDMEQGRAAVEGSAGAIRLVDVEEARGVLPALYDEMRVRIPGMLTRNAAAWKIDVFFDPEKRRPSGFSSRRYLLHETDGIPDGYAIYRQKGDWSGAFPDGKIRIREIITASSAAHTGIWRFLMNIDLFPNVHYWNMPVGDPLRWKVPDHRRITRKRLDALYLRILDVPTALEARGYAADGTLHLAIEDEFLPECGGSFVLGVAEGIGTCRRTDEQAIDLTLGAAELAALYLGGGDAHAMAEAGLVRGDQDSVTLLGRMFRGDVAPWCEDMF